MKLLTKAALLSVIPLLIMVPIGLSLISSGEAVRGRSTLAVGVIVSAVSGATTVYQIDRWSPRKQSLFHLGIMAVTVLPALLLSGWFPEDQPRGALLAIGSFAAAGAVLWTVLYLVISAIERRAERGGTAGKTAPPPS